MTLARIKPACGFLSKRRKHFIKRFIAYDVHLTDIKSLDVQRIKHEKNIKFNLTGMLISTTNKGEKAREAC